MQTVVTKTYSGSNLVDLSHDTSYTFYISTYDRFGNETLTSLPSATAKTLKEKLAKINDFYTTSETVGVAKLEILPSIDVGMRALNSSSEEVFKIMVSGTDAGDVLLGNSTDGKYALWDESEGTFIVQGTLRTSTANKRVEISSADNNIKIYDTNNRLIYYFDDDLSGFPGNPYVEFYNTQFNQKAYNTTTESLDANNYIQSQAKVANTFQRIVTSGSSLGEAFRITIGSKTTNIDQAINIYANNDSSDYMVCQNSSKKDFSIKQGGYLTFHNAASQYIKICTEMPTHQVTHTIPDLENDCYFLLASGVGSDPVANRFTVAKGGANYTRFPTVNDDDNAGYNYGSRWIGLEEEYVCVDSSAGAAVWKCTTSTVSGTSSTGDIVADTLQYTRDDRLVISSGRIEPTGMYHTIDTESSSETDDLTNIAAGETGDILVLRLHNSLHNVVVKHNADSESGETILLANNGDVELTDNWSMIVLMYDVDLDGDTGAWTQLSTSTSSDVVNAVTGYTGTLQLNATTLEIGNGYNPLGSVLTLKFGDAPATYPILYLSSAAATNTTEQMIGVASKGDYVIGINRNSNNKVSTWTTTKAQASTQVGIVRGSGSPNYMKSPVVLCIDENSEYAAIAAYADSTQPGSGDNGFSIIDIRDKEAPVVINSTRHNSSTGIYLDGCSCVRIDGNYLYTANFFSCSFLVFDITDKLDPVLVGGVRGSTIGSISQQYYNGSSWVSDTSTHYLYGACWVEVETIGSKIWAAVSSRLDGAITIYDVTDLSHITLADIDEHTNGGTTTDYHEMAGSVANVIEYCTGDSKWYVYCGTRWQNAQTNAAAGPDVNGRTGWSCEWGTGNRQGSVVVYELNATTGELTYKDEIHGAGSPNYLSEVHGIRYYKDTGDYSNEYVYVACFGDNCGTIINVSNKSSISHVRTFGGAAGSNYTGKAIEPHIVADSNGDAKYCFIATWGDNGFTIWDVENAGSVAPTRVGGKAGSGFTGSPYYLEDSHSLWVDSDNYLYVASRGASDSFNIFSIESSISLGSTPSDTLTDASISAGNDMVVSGNYGYIPSYTANKLVTVDLTDPTNISVADSVTDANMTGPTGVAIGYIDIDLDTYAFVSNYTSDAIVKVDCSDPTNLSVHSTATNATYFNGAYDIDVDNVTDVWKLYVACYDGNRMTVVSGHNLGIVNSVTGSGDPYYLGGARAICHFGDYVAVAAKTDNAVTIYSVGSVTCDVAPEKVKSFTGAGSPNYMSGVEDVCVDAAEEYLYVASRTDDAVVQIDISDPSSAFVSGVILNSGGTYYLDGAVRIRCCQLQGEEFIIVGSWDSGRIVALKKSDFERANIVGIRCSAGDMQVRHAFGSWSKFT